MDITELKKLVRLMNENDLVELEIEEQGSTIRLRKGPSGAGQAVYALPPQPAGAVVLPPAAPGGAAAPAPGAPPAPSGPPAGTAEIKSPIVGTFYRSASPESPPYVNVGDRISPESVVCIVEAMKVMNEIKADVRGEVVEVLVENGEPVEFDQPMFRVKVEA
jgi:acetyl-CoA carboxylase biotin carboxyl carrier protein